MPYPQLDRSKLKILPLSQRQNKVVIEKDSIPLDSPPKAEVLQQPYFRESIARIRSARANNKPRMLAFGAHTIKNGLGPILIDLMEKGWLTHLATNGAGIIHDWEFSYLGQSSEDVRENVSRGQFGIWEETGTYINLAINIGAYRGLGYGESVGAMIVNQGLDIPSAAELAQNAVECLGSAPAKAAAAADLLAVVRRFALGEGFMSLPHPYGRFSVQGNAYRLRIPFTGHPMFGHDIIYNHPMNCGAAIGRTAERDFLTYARQVCDLAGGVYLSVGSAVMSPMIFEKSLSMAQNLAQQQGPPIDGHFILVVDLAPSTWDWSKDGEPPMDNPAYYHRFCKTFNRMGGTMRYLTADNRDFLVALRHELITG